MVTIKVTMAPTSAAETEYHRTEQYRMNLAFLTGRELFARELGLKPIKKSSF